MVYSESGGFYFRQVSISSFLKADLTSDVFGDLFFLVGKEAEVLPCLSYRILRTLCRKLRLPETFHFHHLAHLTPGFVGADLMALCREAAMCAVSRVLMKLPEPRADPEMEALLSRGGRGDGIGTKPASEAQELSPQVPNLSFVSAAQQASVWLRFMIYVLLAFYPQNNYQLHPECL